MVATYHFSLLKTCVVNQNINNEDDVIGSAFDTTIEQFHISRNKEVRFLPREIGERFPNLENFFVRDCGLEVLRNHYFQNMRNLRLLSLQNNKISSIESFAFQGLTKVEHLFFDNNLIETLDGKLFASMVNMEFLNLNNNKIKLLSHTTFKIPGGRLTDIYLRWNVCIDKEYGSDNLDWVEGDIRANCTR